MHHLFWEKLLRVVLVFFANRAPIKQLPQSEAPAAAVNGTFPALFAFGDSILDTGNNNNLKTLTKCNFPPYGRNFFGGIPSGRFSDGNVPSDLIAAALGIKETLPAYLNPNLQSENLSTGVSFASGGSGNDNLTASIQGVLSLSTQLQLFKEYIGRLRGIVGEERINSVLSNSLYLFSAGNNDIAITYFMTLRRLQYDFPSYANLLVGWSSSFIKDLYELGARRIWVLSTLPLGCLPGARAVLGGPFRQCADITNQQAQLFNAKLSSEVDSIKTRLHDYELEFIDVYTPLLDLIQNPEKSGFHNVVSGCCGTGTVELGELCNQVSPFTCANPSTYVFWDSGHPTKRTYEILVSNILKGYNVSSNHL